MTTKKCHHNLHFNFLFLIILLIIFLVIVVITDAQMLSAIGTLLTGSGAIILAIWAINKYFKERDNEAKLNIELSNTNYSVNDSHYVYLDVLLKNEGKVSVYTYKRFNKDNKGDPEEAEYTWKDSTEMIKYSIELQIKKVRQSKFSYNWFDSNQYDPIIDHINLLTDHEDPDDMDHHSFFLDQGEIYHLGCWVQLAKGLYEARVIVIGDKNKLPDDFWARRFPFEVK
jgi:c-di-AMP phosphodiesterase-like protein